MQYRSSRKKPRFIYPSISNFIFEFPAAEFILSPEVHFFFATALAAITISSAAANDEMPQPNINAPPHLYKSRDPKDRFSQIMRTLETDSRLDRSSEKAFLLSFLKILDIPATSQMLVFSTTSLQLRFISPSNPRAIYFNDDIYVGYIPGGRLEIIATDPELGAIFYIFDIPKSAGPIRFERSDRCMNCHAAEETGYIPGLVVKSVMPGPGGGSLEAFRINQMGHHVPLSERFGGWHVTGLNSSNHWGNATGRLVGGSLQRIPNPMGQRFDTNHYPVSTSDILAHLLHEHQIGFFNRAVEASYRIRAAQFGGVNENSLQRLLENQADILVNYMLFTDEAPLPENSLDADPAFAKDFHASRRAAKDGASLRDLDLKSRLFKHRCSYMIHSPLFEGLPTPLKLKIFNRLKTALAPETANHLPAIEKQSLRRILKETLPSLPADW